jgi:hypothetical protein
VSSPTLWFLHQEGCGACASARPSWRAFRAAHPALPTVEADIFRTVWPHGMKFQVRVTPTYVVAEPGRPLRVFEGMATKAQLEKWLRGAGVLP